MRRMTPLMGWASWNAFRTNISETIIKQQAKALIETGLTDCGYEYLNIDDGFFGGRAKNGEVLAHKDRFPNGMRVISDYVHNLGLKAGIYSDAGDNTCGFYYDKEGTNGNNVGLFNREEDDLRRYLVDWNYDFIKVDWCGGLRLGLDEEEQYSKIGSIINRIREACQKEVVYNVCRWQFPGEWVTKVADSWRTGTDIGPSFDSVLYQLDSIKPLRKFCSPGHVNDLDMLQIGNGMTMEEDRTHFAMWCMMSTPLMIGCDLTKISDDTLTILKNKELIAINQDSACLQSFVVKEIPGGEVWLKHLGKENGNKKAVAFLNRSTRELSFRVTMAEIGLKSSLVSMEVRDLTNRRTVEIGNDFTVIVPAHGCIVYQIEAENSIPIKDSTPEYREMPINPISLEEGTVMAEQGAILVDVREKSAYDKSHLNHAIHIYYIDLLGLANQYLPDKSARIILYCQKGKRCYQAAKTLQILGYQSVNYMFLEENTDTYN